MNHFFIFSMVLCSYFLLHAAWEPVGPYGGSIHSLAISPKTGNTIYISSYTTATHMYKSINEGTTWTSLGTLSGYGSSIEIDPSDSNKIIVACGRTLHRSANGGVLWEKTILNSAYIYDIAGVKVGG